MQTSCTTDLEYLQPPARPLFFLAVSHLPGAGGTDGQHRYSAQGCSCQSASWEGVCRRVPVRDRQGLKLNEKSRGKACPAPDGANSAAGTVGMDVHIPLSLHTPSSASSAPYRIPIVTQRPKEDGYYTFSQPWPTCFWLGICLVREEPCYTYSSNKLGYGQVQQL